MLGFAIADGAVPNNEGRGYVVRRVLRRGARYARKYLNAEIGTFFSRVLPTLIDEMGQQFPELVKKQYDIKEVSKMIETNAAMATNAIRSLTRKRRLLPRLSTVARRNSRSSLALRKRRASRSCLALRFGSSTIRFVTPARARSTFR